MTFIKKNLQILTKQFSVTSINYTHNVNFQLVIMILNNLLNMLVYIILFTPSKRIVTICFTTQISENNLH